MTALPFVSDKFAANSSSFGQLPQPPLELRASQDRVSDICVRIVKRSIQERSKSVLESSPQPGDLGLACSPFALCTSSRSLGQSTGPKASRKGTCDPECRSAGESIPIRCVSKRVRSETTLYIDYCGSFHSTTICPFLPSLSLQFFKNAVHPR